MPRDYSLKAKDFVLNYQERTLIMGVMNLTPDSFSQDGRLKSARTPAAHVRFAHQLIKQGADILDIGAESTRPGAQPISVDEEITRIIPTLKLLSKNCPIPISVDTYKPDVAKAALDAGASIINSIRGTTISKSFLKTVREYNAAIVLMHMRGTPQTMQKKTKYKNIVYEIIQELNRSMEFCLEIGIKKDRIIIDPGIGFAKTIDGNLEILNRLDELSSLHVPILIGTSRKSFIGALLNSPVNERVWGTAATVAVGIARGANIVRVHDVLAMKQVAAMTDAIVRRA